MKIVQFKDGTYGLRKITFSGYKFYNFKHKFWVCTNSSYFDYCKTNSIELCRNYIERAKHKVIA